MSTKDIRPTHAYIPCDICGRTLLRGERAEVFIGGGSRHQVCELCKPRALQEGWIREGAVPDYDPAAAAQDRRRSMFGRRRRRPQPDGPAPAPTLDDVLGGDAWPVQPPAASRSARRRREAPAADERPPARERPARERPQRERPPRERPSRERPQRDRSTERSVVEPAPEPAGEPRHVHAVPTGHESKVAAAVEAFNASEHPRTVAGVSRSLGAPTVAVMPDQAHPALVRLVASWELCWYRYEVDLGSARPSVRLDAQGYELSELADPERTPAAVADESGRLHAGLL